MSAWTARLLPRVVGGEQVGFVDDEDGVFAAFVALRGEQLGGLGDQGGPVEAGHTAERADEVVVDAAGADHRVGEVDDGLAGADLTGEHPDGVLVDQPGEPGAIRGSR